jgi:hypothetical protein
MSYTIGTDRGRLRELIGDTGPEECFSNEYLDDLLTERGSVSLAAAAVFMRLYNDTNLLIQRYDRGGRLDAERLAQIRDGLLRQVETLTKDGSQTPVAADPSWIPDADEIVVSRQTDEDGWRTRSNIDDVLTDLEER